MYTAITANKRKTIILLAIFIAFITTLGYIFGLTNHQPGLLYIFGIGSLVYSVISYFFSDKIALGMSAAQPITKQQAPELYRLVENLCITAGLPLPRIYIIDDPSPNAFATGRNPQHAALAVTSGLLQIMDKEELEGVLAHELGHVGNYDIRLMSVVTGLVSVVSIVSDFFFRISLFGGNRDEEEGFNPLMTVLGIAAALLAPIIATVIQLAISRRREYLADASSAMLTRYPEGLAHALEKIAGSEPMEHSNSATAHLFIANPMGSGRGLGSQITRLFSTHPPIQDRIEKLEEMGGHA